MCIPEFPEGCFTVVIPRVARVVAYKRVRPLCGMDELVDPNPSEVLESVLAGGALPLAASIEAETV